MPVVERGPAWHRTLLDAIGEPARFGFLEQWNEHLLEHHEVCVHLQREVAADEPADRVGSQENGGIEHSQHELMLALTRSRVVREHVVEVAQIGKTDPGGAHRTEHTRRAACIERTAQVENVRNRIEHGCSRHIAQGRMQGSGELDVRRADIACELQPLLDGEIGVCVAPFARSQLLKRGCQHAELHRPGSEVSNGHGAVLSTHDDARILPMAVRSS